MKRLLIALTLCTLATPSLSATREYFLEGLGGAPFAQSLLADAALVKRGPGMTVLTGHWWQTGTFIADACAHKNDYIVVIGHSLGAQSAAEVATGAKACGVKRLKMIGIDPPTNNYSVPRGTDATNFVGALGGRIGNAKNIPVPGYGHLAIPGVPVVRRAILLPSQ